MMRHMGPFWGCLLVVLLWMPGEGRGAVIRTEVSVQSQENVQGGWDLVVRVANTGEVTAHGLRVFVFVDGWTEMFSGLGDNEPGEIEEVEARYVPAREGVYTGMIRVHFEEKSGRAHKVFHPFTLRKGAGAADAVEVSLEAPSFHPRAFWRGTPEIGVGVRNGGKESVTVRVQVFLPEGIRTVSPYVEREVAPEERVEVGFPVRVEDLRSRTPRFHVVVWEEAGGVHRSRHLEGQVTIEEGPVLFRVYVGAALGIFAVVMGVLVWRWRRKRQGGGPA